MTTTGDVPRQSASAAPGVPAPAPAAPARAGEEERRPLDLMKFVTSIGSPIALATSLLFYFGWVRSEEQARAFGADASVFAMSTQDYVLRSVNVLFFPVILLLLVALLALRLDHRLRSESPPRWLGPAATALLFSWALFLPLGIVLVPVAGRFGDVTLPFWFSLAVLGPVYGVVLRRLVTGDRRRTSRVVIALLAALVTVLLFWQTERLASLGGEALAEQIKDNLGDRLTRVELYSAKDLHIAGPGVTETRLGGEESAYLYQYSGLFLLQRSGDKYFLLTDGWDREQGKLVVLPDSQAIRVEFGP
jgi:hypothetical protein